MEIKQPKKERVLYRAAILDTKDINIEDRTVVISWASNNPCDRKFGKEILRVTPESIRTKRLDRHMPLLYNHDANYLLGKVIEYWFDNNVAYAKVKFNEALICGQEAFKMVCDGSLVNTSFMYKVFNVRQLPDIDGEPAFEVTDFMPMEISMVTIPADEKTGVGTYIRSDTELLEVLDISEFLEDNTDKDINTRTCIDININVNENEPTEVNVNVVQEEQATETQEQVVQETETQETETQETETQETETQEQAVQATETQEQVVQATETQDSVVNTIEIQEQETEQKVTQITILEETKKMKYTTIAEFVRGIVLNDQSISGYLQRGAELAKLNGYTPQGHVIDMNSLVTRAGEIIQGDPDSGGTLVAPNYRPEMLVNVIQNKTTLAEAGAVFMSATGGQMSIPTISSVGAPVWAGEIEDSSKISVGTGLIESKAHRVTGYVDVGKAEILNAALDLNQVIQDLIAEAFAVKLDYTAYQGTGIDDIPTGILYNPSVQVESLASTVTRANVLSMIKKLEKSNMEATCFVMSPEMKYNLSLVDIGTAGNRFLFDEFTNKLCGYKTVISNNVPDNKLILSNWSDLKIVNYGMLDITVDNVSKMGQYLYRIHFNAFYDIVPTRPANFVVGTKA